MAAKRTLKAKAQSKKKPTLTRGAPAKKKKPAPKKSAPKAPAKKAAPKAPKAEAGKKLAKNAGKPPAKAPTEAKGKPSAPAPAPSKGKPAPAKPSAPGTLVLPPPKSGGKRKGEGLTLVPARSSQPGVSDPPRGRAPGRPGAPQSAPPGKRDSRRPGVTLVRRVSDRPAAGLQAPSLPIPVRKLEAPPSLEQRFSRIEKRLEEQDERTRAEFYGMFDQAWVSHDSALEGNVYTREEIQAGFSAEPILTDSSLQPAADEIRRHREAIEYVRDFGLRKRLPVTVDIIKKIYLILHPSEGDLKTVKYRRDVPQHRLYFHEYAPPDKIAYKVRQVVDWLNEPETRKTRNALRIAARAHYDLVRVFPFQSDSGKVARLFMNLLLYRAGYPPAIIHAKERQNYYEALKGEPNRVLRIVQDAVEDGLSSIEKFLDEQESKKRPFVS